MAADDPAVLRQQRRVDERDLLGHHVGEDALERGQLEHAHVVCCDLAADLHRDALRDPAGERGEDPAEALGWARAAAGEERVRREQEQCEAHENRVAVDLLDLEGDVCQRGPFELGPRSRADGDGPADERVVHGNDLRTALRPAGPRTFRADGRAWIQAGVRIARDSHL